MAIQKGVRKVALPALSDASAACSERILQAFRFLEDVGGQVEAVIAELDAQIRGVIGSSSLNLRVGEFDDDGCYDVSGWLSRSVTYSFAIYSSSKRGRPRAVMHAAFQVGLAPSRQRADDEFFPNVSVMVCAAENGEDEWGPWGRDEFELDHELLESPADQNGDPWKTDGKHRWVPSSGYPAVVFAVPLVDLRCTGDVKVKVADRLLREIEELFRRGLSSASA